MQYSIPECNMTSLERKLTRIRNKCEKYGLDFHYDRIGEHFEERTEDIPTGEIDTATGRPITKRVTELVKFFDIDVEGKAEVNGWRFAASLEYTHKGNIINGVSDIEIPERYYSCDPWCEHCKTRRDRRSSYIVLNTETGEFKQVGKSCLADFTHGLSAESAALCESWFKEAEVASEWSGFGCSPNYFAVPTFMATAAEVIRLFGYIRRHDEGLCTADHAEMIYRMENGMRVPFVVKEFYEKTYADAKTRGFDSKNQRSVELANTVRDWIINNEKDSNYFHNLKVACSLDAVESGAIGLLVSAFPAYNRDLEMQAERRERERKEAEQRAHSTYMGEIGDKVSFEIASYYLISSWETQWGTTYVYKFTDKEGRNATWKTSGWFDDWVVGKTIKGTVKEHKEFNGIKQTELTRCRVA